MKYKITVDTGGTFTDALVSSNDHPMVIGKALTTHDRVFDGVKAAIESASDNIGVTFSHLLKNTDLLIYGTTRSTNAIVTKRVAKTAFITTKGFGDTLFLKDGGKFSPHDFSSDYPGPYISRCDTFEIEERIGSEGEVSVPFNDSQALEVIDKLISREFEAVAVCFLWSVLNPNHEKRFGALMDKYLPGIPYTLSHELIPVIREYRRASATAIDASLKPLMQEHLHGLQDDLRASGFNGELLVGTISGGCNYVETLVQKPIYTVGSGPAAAPVAALNFSEVEDFGNDVIVCDTGGTTFDVGLVRDGELTFTRDTWLGAQYTGDILGVSAVDMRSIGAGGGSIAWIDEGGLMRVGPQSAGSMPGPACYGRGGKQPTVSDAAAVLGYLDPDFFLGGRMNLDLVAARAALKSVSDPIGLSVEEAAYRVLALASDFMMRAVHDITINEGVNPKESTIVAGGGAAGLNIMMIAKELGCERVILPKVASALSASGMQYSDVVFEETASFLTTTGDFNIEGVNSVLAKLKDELMSNCDRLSLLEHNMEIQYLVEARYAGQIWELDTPLLSGRIDHDQDLARLAENFHQVHERVFAVRDEGSDIEFVNWKARLRADAKKPSEATIADRVQGGVAPASVRQCYFGNKQPVETPIIKGESLYPGDLIHGPAVIEEPTTTLVVFPGMRVRVSKHLNFILLPEEEK